MWSEQKAFQSVCKVSELTQSQSREPSNSKSSSNLLNFPPCGHLCIKKQENKNASLNALLCSHLS